MFELLINRCSDIDKCNKIQHSQKYNKTYKKYPFNRHYFKFRTHWSYNKKFRTIRQDNFFFIYIYIELVNLL